MQTRQPLNVHGYSTDELFGKPITYVDGYFDEQKINQIACDVKAGEISPLRNLS